MRNRNMGPERFNSMQTLSSRLRLSGEQFLEVFCLNNVEIRILITQYGDSNFSENMHIYYLCVCSEIVT